MIRLLLLLTALLCCALHGGDKVLIWAATAPGLPGKAFLAGSIHTGKGAWYPLDRAYDQALSAADAVYFEVNEPNRMEVVLTARRHCVFQNGKKLSSVLGFKDFQTVRAFFRQHSSHVNPLALDRLRPWFLGIEVANLYMRLHPEYSGKYGLETVIASHLNGKPARSLETIDSQFQALSDVPDEAAARVLMDDIRDFKHAGKNLEQAMAALENGTPEPLTMLENELAFKHPEFYFHVFQKRNEAFAEKIYALLKTQQTVFVLIGTGHFAGKASVLEYLRQKGCIIRQLSRAGQPGKIAPE